jgi:hypothetical protein
MQAVAATTTFLAMTMIAFGLLWQSKQPNPLEVDWRDHQGRVLALEEYGSGIYSLMETRPTYDLTQPGEPEVVKTLVLHQTHWATDSEGATVIWVNGEPLTPAQLAERIREESAG